jgi:hypothetical protein
MEIMTHTFAGWTMPRDTLSLGHDYHRDLVGVDKPFGGKAFVIGADFRQTSLVVRERQGRDVRVAQPLERSRK